MKTPLKFITILLMLPLWMSSCDGLLPDTDPDTDPLVAPFDTGLDKDLELELAPYVPMDLSIVTLEDVGQFTSSSRVLLDEFVPPVRSQGAYGTCTAWGVGYNCRTIMYARENNLTPADLENNDNICSPKDLFLAYRDFYPSSLKNECSGACPNFMFDVLIERGAAPFSTIPYDDMEDCTQGTSNTGDNAASKFKIESYRRVDPTDIEAIKSYISMGRPIQVSCELGHNFFYMNNADVLMTDDYPATEKEQSEMLHGRHSMCLVGYDDDKGPNGAVRIVNSWSTGWGDKGYCWIDYKFFAERFCFGAYIIESDKGGLQDGMVDNEEINPNFQVDGKDLITVRFTDEAISGRDRMLTYNVFNKGKETIKASEDWNIIYYYYNAYDPENDYGIVIYDYYTDDVGDAYQGQNNDFSTVSANLREYGTFNWWNYVDVPAGYSVAKAVSGDPDYDYDFEFDYEMPNITGDYYLVLMADGFNAIDEQYEQNNFIFLTGENREPIKFVNGVPQGTIAKKMVDNVVNERVLQEYEPNAYSTDEVAKLIKYQQRTGLLQKRAAQMKKSSKGKSSKRLVKPVLPRTM